MHTRNSKWFDGVLSDNCDNIKIIVNDKAGWPKDKVDQECGKLYQTSLVTGWGSSGNLCDGPHYTKPIQETSKITGGMVPAGYEYTCQAGTGCDAP